MPCIFAGEDEITLGKHHHTWRPSFKALYEIERHTGMPIAELTACICHTAFPITILRLILRECLPSAHAMEICDKDLILCLPTLHRLLLHATGTAIDWPDTFRIVVGMMGRSSQEFWQMTWAEYQLAVEGFCMLHGVDITCDIPANAKELQEMLRQFPDSLSTPIPAAITNVIAETIKDAMA